MRAVLAGIFFFTVAYGLQPGGASPTVETVAAPALPSEVEGGAVQTLSSPLWRIDHGFDTTLQLKNAKVFEPVSATLVLHSVDGTDYPLPVVDLGPGETVRMDLRRVLQRLPASLRRSFSETGSASLVYKGEFGGAVTASFRIVNLDTGVAFNNQFGTPPDEAPLFREIEGLYWTPQSGGDCFISVANTSFRQIPVTVKFFGPRAEELLEENWLVPPHGSHFAQLSSLGVAIRPGEAGGVRVSYSGTPRDILVSGGVEDPGTGYSADLPMWHRGVGEPQRLTFSAVGLMYGEVSAESGFPSGTRFSPFLTARNTTERHLPVIVVAHATEPGSRARIELPRFVLAPGQAVSVDLGSSLAIRRLQERGPLNFALSFSGQSGDLLFSLGSVDQTGNYVLQSHPHPIGPRPSQAIPFWSVEDGDDSVIALWNPSDTVQDLILEIHYVGDEISGDYRLPISLAPGASDSVSIRGLIESKQADEAGNVIPQGARHGGARLMSPLGLDQYFEVEVGGGILNVTHGTCSWWCVTCEGYLTYRVLPDYTIDLLVGGNTGQFTAEARHVSYGPADFTYSSTWSTSDANRVTVGNGVISAVSYGITPVGISAQKSLPKYDSNYCGYNPICPGPFAFQASQSARTRIPKWCVPTFSEQTTQGCVLSSPTVRKDIVYGVFDEQGQLGFAMNWIQNEIVTSSSSCNVQVGSSASQTPTFHDTIFNCVTGCTFQSEQRYTVTVDGQTFNLTARKCVGAGCPEAPGWAVTANKSAVTVELIGQ